MGSNYYTYDGYQEGIEQINAERGAQVINYETSKLLPWLMLCSILSGFAVAASIVSGIVAWQNCKEAKQIQIQLMYANAIMLREGLVQPGDMVYGPEGNLEYKQHELIKPPAKGK